jgi:hypothetical protein
MIFKGHKLTIGLDLGDRWSGGTEVDYQVATPTESSTPNLHRATIAQQRVRMEGWRQKRLGSMGTIWKKKK